MSKISFQNRKLLNDHPPPPMSVHNGGWGLGGLVVVNVQKASFQNMKPKVRSCLLIGASVLSSIVNNFTCCKLHFSTGGGGVVVVKEKNSS